MTYNVIMFNYLGAYRQMANASEQVGEYCFQVLENLSEFKGIVKPIL